MKIAILGGAFNPPHLGHQLIASQILDFTDADQIWLTPCYQHTFNKNLASVKHRVAMTKTLVNQKVKLCLEEIDHKLSGETIELMRLLVQKHPRHEFCFIIGSDNLKHFKKWGQWQKLLLNFPFLVFPRPKFKNDFRQYGLANRQYKLKLISHSLLVTSDISSTNIRKRVKQGLSITHLVPQKVKEYIEKHNLYA